MPISFLGRAQRSLRARLFFATAALVAIALAVAAVSFERAARGVIYEAVESHLAARVNEAHLAVQRFQRERALTVRNWAEAEAMQLTLDTGDAKFAEDYLRRVIQEQDGSIAAAALVDVDGTVLAAVRAGPRGMIRGIPVPAARGATVELPELRRAGAVAADGIAVDVALMSDLIRDANDGEVLFILSHVRDFAGDLCGFVAAAVTPAALSRLLADLNGEGSSMRPILTSGGNGMVVSLPGIARTALQPVLAAPAGAPGTLERIDAGDESLLAVRTGAAAGAPGWSAMVLVPREEAFGRLYWLRGMLATLYSVVLGGVAFASVGALRQAARPLSNVTESMVKVAAGDLSTRVHVEYTDELGELVQSFNTMVSEVERSRDELQRTEALRREVQIAHQIQTAILPVSPAVKGFEVAARMKPAEDVGGDLYDILSFEDTFWVIVGDVSGHGINSGLVMMMAQAAAYGAIADDPHAAPSAVIAAVNRVVHENVRRRMGRDDYLTLMVARHLGDGRFVAAGAHQPVFIARADGQVDVLECVGPWVGICADPPGVTEYEFRVGKGDLVCLITDGVVEASDAAGGLYGEDRLSAVLGGLGTASASEALARVFSSVEAFASTQSDDMTAVLLRRKND